MTDLVGESGRGEGVLTQVQTLAALADSVRLASAEDDGAVARVAADVDVAVAAVAPVLDPRAVGVAQEARAAWRVRPGAANRDRLAGLLEDLAVSVDGLM